MRSSLHTTKSSSVLSQKGTASQPLEGRQNPDSSLTWVFSPSFHRPRLAGKQTNKQTNTVPFFLSLDIWSLTDPPRSDVGRWKIAFNPNWGRRPSSALHGAFHPWGLNARGWTARSGHPGVHSRWAATGASAAPILTQPPRGLWRARLGQAGRRPNSGFSCLLKLASRP